MNKTFSCLWLCFGLIACTPVIILGPVSDSEKSQNPQPSIANPASQYCSDNNGTLEIRRDAIGNEVGYCLFIDQTECEEWAYFQQTCEPGQNPTTRF